MPQILTLEQAKTHLVISGSAKDAEILRLILRAEAALFQYIGFADLAAFYYEFGEGTPYILEAALCLMLTELHDNRRNDPLTQAVQDLVRRYRLPVIA
jgi:hypothetical protein